MSEKAQIQNRASTIPNRYPRTFQAAADLTHKDRIGGSRVLSFGCSRGAEAVSLADLYFTHPDDYIAGVDISPSAIRYARLHNSHERVRYYLQKDAAFAKEEPFDVIFAMSVLCVWPMTKTTEDISELFPFARFIEICEGIDRRLKVGGHLVIYNSNYCFGDTPLAARFAAMPDPTNKSGFVRKFEPDGSPMTTRKYRDTIFTKLRDGD